MVPYNTVLSPDIPTAGVESGHGGSNIKEGGTMERIVITWRASDDFERGSYTRAISGDLIDASRVYAELIRVLRDEVNKLRAEEVHGVPAA